SDLRPLPDVAMTGTCTRECREFGHSDACWMPGQPSPPRRGVKGRGQAVHLRALPGAGWARAADGQRQRQARRRQRPGRRVQSGRHALHGRYGARRRPGRERLRPGGDPAEPGGGVSPWQHPCRPDRQEGDLPVRAAPNPPRPRLLAPAPPLAVPMTHRAAAPGAPPPFSSPAPWQPSAVS
ncbi:unnamed protein product, partial [Tetraodon nigroviridis]